MTTSDIDALDFMLYARFKGSLHQIAINRFSIKIWPLCCASWSIK